MVRRKSSSIFHAGLQQLLYWCLELYENIAADLQQSSGNFQDGEGAEKYLICDVKWTGDGAG